MKKSNFNNIVWAGLVVLVLALIALPLSNLLVAKSYDSTETQSAEVDVESNVDADAVSVLLSGNVVGSDRGALGGLRRPASAFVP